MRWYRTCMLAVTITHSLESFMQVKLAAVAFAALVAAAPAMAGQSIATSFLSGSNVERAILAGDGDDFGNYIPSN